MEQIRYDLARELIEDIGRLDAELKESHKRIASAVRRIFDYGHRSIRGRPDDRRRGDRQRR